MNVTLNLRDTSGQIVASVVKTLAPLAHVAQYFTEMFPTGFDEFEGTLEIVSASGPVSGVALRYDNPGGTVFATAPVIVIP